MDLIRQDDGLWPTIRLVNQSFDMHPDCLHRVFHTRRLTVQNPDSLPLLYRVTQLRVFPAPDYASGPAMDAANLRPVSGSGSRAPAETTWTKRRRCLTSSGHRRRSASEFEGMDPVSFGLRSLGSRLEELDIRALVTSDLFLPGGGGDRENMEWRALDFVEEREEDPEIFI